MKKILSILLMVCASGWAQTPSLPITPVNNLKIQNPVPGTINDSVMVWKGSDKIARYLPISVIVAKAISEGGAGDLQTTLTAGSTGFVGSDIIMVKEVASVLKGELAITDEGAQLTTGNAKVIVGATELELRALSNSAVMTNTETTFVKPVVGVVAESEDQFPVLGQVNELIGGYVPYEGATSPVNLGGFDLTTEGNINAYAGVFTGSPGTQPFIVYKNGLITGNFFAEITANRIWSMPDRSGEVSLLEDLDNYIPLAGTPDGVPITGPLEFYTSYGDDSVWMKGTDSNIENKFGAVSLQGFEFASTNTTNENSARMQISGSQGGFGFSTGSGITGYNRGFSSVQSQPGFVFSDSDPDAIGIVGYEDYSANNNGTNRNIYPQTGWVRDYVTLENAIKQDGTAIVVGDFSITRTVSADVKNFINFDSDTDQTNINGKSGVNISASSGAISLSGTVNLPNSTASTIPGLDASKNLVSLPTTTYPTLTELSYVKGVTGAIQPQLNAKAPLASPALTGTPTAPTQSANDNSTKVATTAYSDAKVADFINDGATTIAPSQNVVFDNLALKAPINNASHTGTFTLPNGSLVITSGASTDVLLGTGAATPVGSLVRAQTINGDTSTGSALSSGMVIPRAIWELQRLITLMPVYIVNSTTTVLSTATLNSTYPNVGVGSRISCRSITTGGIMYTKDTEAGSSDVWNMTPITVAP